LAAPLIDFTALVNRNFAPERGPRGGDAQEVNQRSESTLIRRVQKKQGLWEGEKNG